jgi:hypothetical protein
MPDPDKARQLREVDPKLYRQWRREVSKQAEHDRWIEAAPFKVPARVTLRGQVLGLIAVLFVLALAGYAVYKDHSWAAVVLTGIDVVGLAAVFASSSKEQEPRHEQHKHSSAAEA